MTEEILIKLSTIASIEKGQTLSTSYEATLTHNSWSTSFMRTYNGEHRRKTVDYIKDIFERSIAIALELKKDLASYESYDILINAIKAALLGVENLKTTYKGDHYIIGLINTMIEETTKHINAKAVEVSPQADFFEAIKTVNYEFIENYLYDGNFPNVKNKLLQNGLHCAADKQHYNEKILNILLNFNVDVYAKDMHGNTPLYYAISTGNVAGIIKLEEYISKKKREL